MKTIEELRIEIDGIDDGFMALLNKRALIAAEIGLVKESVGMPVVDVANSIRILNRVSHIIQGA